MSTCMVRQSLQARVPVSHSQWFWHLIYRVGLIFLAKIIASHSHWRHVNANKYKSILRNYIHPVVKHFCPEWIFQQKFPHPSGRWVVQRAWKWCMLSAMATHVNKSSPSLYSLCQLVNKTHRYGICWHLILLNLQLNLFQCTLKLFCQFGVIKWPIKSLHVCGFIFSKMIYKCNHIWSSF